MNQELELIGVPVSGPEDDYLFTTEDKGPNSLLSMTGLLKQAGAQRITWQEACAFETSNPGHFTRYREDYLKLNGRVPRVYKVKIKVEVEELSEEDSQAFWETKNQQSSY